MNAMDQITLELAGCVILDDAGKILLLHRNTPKLTQWELPGGKVDENEDIPTAAVREVMEEMGVTVRIVKKLGSDSFDDSNRIMHYSWFLAEIVEGEPSPIEDMFDDLKAFGWETLKKSDQISPNVQNLIRAYPDGISAGSERSQA